MSAQEAREKLKAMYPSKRWAKRVDRMRDDQVIAIYLKKMQEQTKPKDEKKSEDEDPDIPF